MKINWIKKATAIVAATSLFLGSATSSIACTGLYAGRETTASGNTLYGRCEDYGPNYAKHFKIIPAADHESGEMYTDTYNFEMPYPAHTLRYSVIQDDPSEYDNTTPVPFAEAGINEYGVSVSATVSTYFNKKVFEADPLKFYGITELSMTSVILQSAVRARHGVEILAEIIDNYGHGNTNIDDYENNEVSTLFIADQSEVWVMEIVSGKQYIATKLSPDKVSVIPNVIMTGQVNVDSPNVIASAGLISTAKEGGFYVSDVDGENEINVAKSYSEGYDFYESYRAYFGTYLLNKELADSMDVVPKPYEEIKEQFPNISTADNTSALGPFNLQFDPSKDVIGSLDLLALRNIFKSHGEETQYPTTSHNVAADGTEIRSIGTYQQNESHIFEIRHDSGIPATLATIEWLSMGPAEFSVYLPFYSGAMTVAPDAYQTVMPKYFDNESIYWLYNELGNIGNGSYFRQSEEGNYTDRYGRPVEKEIAEKVQAYLEEINISDELHKYFDKTQKEILEIAETDDAEILEAAKTAEDEITLSTLANELANQQADYAYEAAFKKLEKIDKLVKECSGYEAKSLYEIDLSASGNANDENDTTDDSTLITTIGIAIAVLCGIGIFFLTRKTNKKEDSEEEISSTTKATNKPSKKKK